MTYGKSVSKRTYSETTSSHSDKLPDLLVKRYRPSKVRPPRKQQKSVGTADSQKLERTIMKKRLKIDPVVSIARESVFEDGNIDFIPSLKIDKENYSDMMFFNLGEIL